MDNIENNIDNSVENNIVVGEDGSYYDGGYWSFIGHNLALALGTSATAGIAYPWLRCWYQRWLASHTVISGKRMRFDGAGGELFGKYILWLILSYITCGIYGFWRDVNIKRWVSEHTYFEGEPDNNSYFDGKVSDYFITKILSTLAFAVPFAGPAWSKIIMTRWWVRHTVIDSRRLVFDGTVGDLFIKYLLWGLLTTVTCGIFAWFMPVKYLKWETEHTLDENETVEAKNAKINYKTQIHTDAVMLKTMDSEKLNEIKIEMLNDAKQGIEIGSGNDALIKLESAIRYSDLLRDAEIELSDEENVIIGEAIVLARKIKAVKPVETKSKKWVVIVVAIIAALMLVGGIAGAALVAGVLFFKQTPTFELGGITNSNRFNEVDSIEINYSDFCYSFKSKLENDGATVLEVATGVDGAAYTVTNPQYNSLVYVSVSSDDYGNLCVVDIRADRIYNGSTANEIDAQKVMSVAYSALGLGNIDNYSPYTLEGVKCDYYSGWEFYYKNSADKVSVYITPQ